MSFKTLALTAAIALLVWGTHLVRTGVLRVAGEGLRRLLALGHCCPSEGQQPHAGRGREGCPQASCPLRDLVADSLEP